MGGTGKLRGVLRSVVIVANALALTATTDIVGDDAVTLTSPTNNMMIESNTSKHCTVSLNASAVRETETVAANFNVIAPCDSSATITLVPDDPMLPTVSSALRSFSFDGSSCDGVPGFPVLLYDAGTEDLDAGDSMSDRSSFTVLRLELGPCPKQGPCDLGFTVSVSSEQSSDLPWLVRMNGIATERPSSSGCGSSNEPGFNPSATVAVRVDG